VFPDHEPKLINSELVWRLGGYEGLASEISYVSLQKLDRLLTLMKLAFIYLSISESFIDSSLRSKSKLEFTIGIKRSLLPSAGPTC
jgi:hypothetical protein